MEPESPVQLDAVLLLKRAARERDLLRSARDAGWVSRVARVVQLAAIVAGVLLFAPDSGVVFVAIAIVLGGWGVEQALGRRIDALVELFELQCANSGGDASTKPGKTGGTRPVAAMKDLGFASTALRLEKD